MVKNLRKDVRSWYGSSFVLSAKDFFSFIFLVTVLVFGFHVLSICSTALTVPLLGELRVDSLFVGVSFWYMCWSWNVALECGCVAFWLRMLTEKSEIYVFQLLVSLSAR